MKNFSFRFLSPCKGLCHSLGITMFALCAMFATLESCKKSEAVETSPKEQFYEGDEYDQGLVIEEPDEVDEPLEPDYQSEGGTTISSITSATGAGGFNTNMGCDVNLFKYKDYIGVGTKVAAASVFTINLSQNDSITAVTANKPEIKFSGGITKIDAKTYSIEVWFDGVLKTKSVKFSFTLASGKTVSKSIKTVGLIYFDDGENAIAYGTSAWVVSDTRRQLDQSPNASSTLEPTAITSAFIPQIGDILYFGDFKMGVVSTPPVLKAATKSKPAAYKFKVVEMNAKCTAKKTTKSQAMSDPTKILSADGATYATKFYRG